MGLFSKSSSTSMQTTNVSTIIPTATGGGVNVMEGSYSMNVQTVDPAIVNRALNTVDKSVESSRLAYEDAHANFQTALDQTLSFAKGAIASGAEQSEHVAMAYQTAHGKETPLNANNLLMLGLVLGAALVFARMRKGGKV